MGVGSQIAAVRFDEVVVIVAEEDGLCLIAKDTDTGMGINAAFSVEVVEVLDAFLYIVSENPIKVLSSDWAAKDTILATSFKMGGYIE